MSAHQATDASVPPVGTAYDYLVGGLNSGSHSGPGRNSSGLRLIAVRLAAHRAGPPRDASLTVIVLEIFDPLVRALISAHPALACCRH
ncbi:MAG TPA: hypothetical protein VGS03_19520 [Candidatus Polarisedimenticolia bacterium]|nr:hypothetical protein [Candidatus Polarisedimenticolia bacterium]